MLLRMTNISRVYGTQTILKDIDFRIDEKDRIGLIGANGAGKTTLFRIITGQDKDYEPEGDIYYHPDLKIGYLPQEVQFSGDESLFEEVLKAFSHLQESHELLRRLEHDMTEAEGERLEQIMTRYSQVMELYERQGGYSYENETREVLFGLGFSRDDLDLPAEVLSGGQKSRAALARLLLTHSNLLLLDEPTNHLDITATEWLERFLLNYQGALVVISHDRFFLDKVTTRTAEIEYQQLYLYDGNYTKYLDLKAERIEQELKAYELQQAEIKRQEEFIRRNIAGQKTKQAQDRRKKLERVERLNRPNMAKKRLALNFKPDMRGGNEVLSVKWLKKSYGDRALFSDLHLSLRRLDRIGIVGPNGTGKTTFIRLIIGQEAADRGKIRIGQNITVGYYDQHMEGLNPTNRVIDEVWEVDPGLKMVEIRNFLGRFLFSGEDVFKVVGTLSGGEQSRVQLAKLILARMNFLILDEPTNHLDLPSRQALEDFLAEYDGTLLIVSHDRYFLDKVANRLLYFDGKEVTEYPGNYTDFVRRRELEQEMEAASRKETAELNEQKQQYLDRKKIQREREKRERSLRKRIADIEAELTTLEARQNEITDLLSDTEIYNDGSRVRDLNIEYDTILKRSMSLYEEWEDLDLKVQVILDEARAE